MNIDELESNDASHEGDKSFTSLGDKDPASTYAPPEHDENVSPGEQEQREQPHAAESSEPSHGQTRYADLPDLQRLKDLVARRYVEVSGPRTPADNESKPERLERVRHMLLESLSLVKEPVASSVIPEGRSRLARTESHNVRTQSSIMVIADFAPVASVVASDKRMAAAITSNTPEQSAVTSDVAEQSTERSAVTSDIPEPSNKQSVVTSDMPERSTERLVPTETPDSVQEKQVKPTQINPLSVGQQSLIRVSR